MAGPSSKPSRRLAFDAAGFYADIEAAARKRGLSMHALSFEIGVHHSTLSHMKTRDMAPDGANLAALSNWSGIDIRRYGIDREAEEVTLR